MHLSAYRGVTHAVDHWQFVLATLDGIHPIPEGLCENRAQSRNLDPLSGAIINTDVGLSWIRITYPAYTLMRCTGRLIIRQLRYTHMK